MLTSDARGPVPPRVPISDRDLGPFRATILEVCRELKRLGDQPLGVGESSS